MSDSGGVPWDGRGLPPAAQRRLARARESGVATSLLDAPAAAALAGAGFRPVGEVMGSIAQRIGWSGVGCGVYVGNMVSRTITSLEKNRWSGLSPLADAVTHGYDTALARLVAEATALGADGVVGVRVTDTVMDRDVHEYVAMGTAVRGRASVHAVRPFVTELSGQDFAKLLHAGWLPIGIAFGIAAAVRHDDYRTYRQQRMWSNTEVSGYTDLVTKTRAAARTLFRDRARRIGGDDATVTDVSLRVWGSEINEHVDHYAMAVVRGNTVLRFAREKSATTMNPLTMLPLTDARPRRSR